MINKTLLYILLCFISVSGFCQNNNSGDMVKKGIRIDTLYVTGAKKQRVQAVNVGTKVSKIDNVILKQNLMSSLGDVLADNSTVYIKSLGQGAMSTSSFRGTSSSHTQVLWNGIKINPAMSTSFDFSQLPVFFMDNVSLFHGNSSLKGGSGALGGTVNIENSADYSDNSLGRLFLEYGSCNTYTGALSIKLGNEKFISKTKLFTQGSDNDFRYLNKVYSKDEFYERRKESEFSQYGLMQEFYYKYNKYSSFSANIWYQYGERRLPQPIIVNVTQHEKQKETNLKSYISYDYKKDAHAFNLKVAYLYSYLYWKKWYDNEAYGVTTTDNYSNSLQAIADYTYTPSSLLRINSQLSYTRDWVNATSYSVKEASRDVYNVQANILYNVSSSLSFQLQGMGELTQQKFSPTFSFGGIYKIYADVLRLKGNVAYNYKLPSMNDLYWQPGGDENLKPEEGFSYDLTLSYANIIKEKYKVGAEVTGYLMNINNWIMWMPNKDSWFWRPKNLKKVKAYGIEFSANGECDLGEFNLYVNLNYTFSRSMNAKARFEGDATKGTQLPYVPKHKANARIQAKWRNIGVSYLMNYTGKRYVTEDESYSTNAYLVNNLSLWYSYSFSSRYSIMPKITVNNLFNTYYESTQYYPMPLRMIYFGVVFGF